MTDPAATAASHRVPAIVIAGLAAAVVLQEALTVYPGSATGSHVVWGALSLVLVGLIARGSRVAWFVLTGLAAFGAAVFVLSSLSGAAESIPAPALAVAYLSQLALLTLVKLSWRRAPAAALDVRSGSPVR